jgi:predicted small integral membrane protein
MPSAQMIIEPNVTAFLTRAQTLQMPREGLIDWVSIEGDCHFVARLTSRQFETVLAYSTINRNGLWWGLLETVVFNGAGGVA